MSINTLSFLSVLLTAIAIGSSFAHLLELPRKIHMPAEQYLMVQQLYRGWALLGLAVVGALVTTIAMAIQLHDRRPPMFQLASAAAACIGASLILFFVFTFPANRRTENWTKLPGDWQQLRSRWEYSHAVSAGLYLLALALLTLALLH
jgi:hypothetical protein